MKTKRLWSIAITICFLCSTYVPAAAYSGAGVSELEENGGTDSRIVYAQDFDDCTWWENGDEPAAAEFERTPFFAVMDNGEKMQSAYEILSAANGRAADDKSLHINQKFNHEFGKNGADNLSCMTEDNMWVGNGSGSQGTNGVSHRITLDSGNTQGSERYLHISFSAAQSYMPSSWIDGEQGSGLDVSFEFNTSDGEKEKEMLHWYNDKNQGVFGDFFTVLIKENKWISYDYIVDTETMTEDIYVNGCRVADRIDITEAMGGNGVTINGISKLNFQVRDTNLWGANRDTDVYLDDIKVEYSKGQPEVSTYSVFGETAYINASEKYVNKETGIIYNYGQTLNEMKQYLTGKNVYLVKEKAESRPSWPLMEEYDSQSLGAVTLNDGRSVSPVLFAEDGKFTYRYVIKQPQATAIKAEISALNDGFRLSWTGNAADCCGIEIFRNAEKIAVLAGDAQEYEDTDAEPETAYDYAIRELLPDKNVSEFTASLSNVSKPENFAAVQLPNRPAVRLTWDAPDTKLNGGVTGYKIYRDGAELAEVGADVLEYTDDSADIDTNTTYRYSVAAVYGRLVSGTTPEISVFVSFDGSDSRVVYAQDFNSCTWWENDNEPSKEEFERTPFYKAMDDGEKMQSTYEILNAANGRAAEDKSLHINQKFSHEFGSDDMSATTEDGLWVADSAGIGTNGVSHRITLDSGRRKSYERYLHISFSAAQSYMPSSWINGEQGSGLDVSFVFNTSDGEKEKEMLHWYNDNNQGVFGKFFTVRIKENKWINYDYIIDTETMTEDVYVNGYRTADKIDITEAMGGKAVTINGLGKLNFQVRDTNRWGDNRNMDVYLDDIKVEYSKEQPEVSTYSVFGGAAYINASEKYVNKETGVIYNYGQTLNDMKQYLTGKNVYLVKEKAESRPSWPLTEEYDSQSLDAVELDDGRMTSPILFAEDGMFTYRYEIKQPRMSDIRLEVSDIDPDAIVLGWNDKTADCRGIEVFRDGIKIAVLAEDAQTYRDTDVVQQQRYEYCIRELFDSGDVGTFSSAVSSFISTVGRPENFTAAPVPNQLTVKMTWEKSKYGTVTGYKIYRNGAVLAEVGSEVYGYTDDSALTVGKEYSYSVAAVGLNDEMSDRTAEVVLVPDVISPPLGLKTEDVDGTVKLMWDSVEGAKAYEVYRNGEYIDKISECFYAFDDCAEDSFYEFYVKTVNELGAASRASKTVRYVKHNSRLDIYSNIFDDKLDRNYSLTATDTATIEQGQEYGAIGEKGIRIGFNSQSFNGQSAGFMSNNGLDLSKIKNSAAEIRFLMYVPEGLDISKLSFAAVRDYNSNFAGKTVRLQAAVSLDRYVKNTGWSFVRIPLKDLPNKGVFTAKEANIPYEADFNYSKVKELVFVSKIEGAVENTYFMVDEIAVYADRAPEVISVKANGSVLENDAIISGRTNQFSVRFDAVMDEKQLSSNELKIVCGNKRLPSVVEHDAENDEYIISLLDKLEPNKRYSVVVEKAVSKVGTSQKGKYTLAFVTDSDVSTETVVKTVNMNLKSMSGTTDAAIRQEIGFDGGAANETMCGFDIEISYDANSLLLDKNEVKIISDLKNSGIKAQNKNGKLIISCAADKTKEISLKDGIGTFAIKALKSGSSQISAAGKLYRYYSDADVVKEFDINGSATISATKGSGGSGSGGLGSSGGSSAIGGARPGIGSGGQNNVTPEKTVFSDISSVDWAREGILYLSERGIINGYEDNTFRPDNSITREEFVAIIVRAFEVEYENADSDFSDVDKSAWYYRCVSGAVNAGIINGIETNLFGTGDSLSRQDMCTILCRVMERIGSEPDKIYSRMEFADENEIADYAKEAVGKLQQMGIVNGMGENMFVPEGNVTRAMAAKAIYQMMQGNN